MSSFTFFQNGSWLNRRRLTAYPRIIFFLYMVIGIAWTAGLDKYFIAGDGTLYTDFINIYAAGQAVDEGHAETAYDAHAHRRAQDAIAAKLAQDSPVEPAKDFIPWLYPPLFFAVAGPAHLLSYYPALILYEALGFGLYFFSIRRLAPRQAQTGLLIATFPGAFVNAFCGQNGFLTASMLALGLALLDSMPVAAGCVLGLLAYKPHFFVLLPIVLTVGRYWKALIASLCSATVYIGLSFAVFGIKPWQAFFATAFSASKEVLEAQGQHSLTTAIHSVFSMVRLYGGSIHTAYIAQGLIAVAALVLLASIWSRKPVSLAVRGSALVAASFLISPYSFVYDQVLLAIPIALLARQAMQDGFLSYEKTFLCALWLLPVMVKDGTQQFPLTFTPPMMAGLLALCWRRAWIEQLNNVAVAPEYRGSANR